MRARNFVGLGLLLVAGCGIEGLFANAGHEQYERPASKVTGSAMEEVTVSQITPTGEQAQLSFDTGAESFIGTCPDCGSQLEYAEGCVKCHVCGFSECG